MIFKIGSVVAVFLSGFVFCMNLTALIETNPNYEAEWWKVAFACFWAVFFGWTALKSKRTVN